jgi:hypothetical protein
VHRSLWKDTHRPLALFEIRDEGTFLPGVSAAVVGTAGCNRATERSSGQVTVPYLEVENYETSAATVTVLLTDTNQNVHVWKTVDLDVVPRGTEEGFTPTSSTTSGWSPAITG